VVTALINELHTNTHLETVAIAGAQRARAVNTLSA
jgi:hypothetical protein